LQESETTCSMMMIYCNIIIDPRKLAIQ